MTQHPTWCWGVGVQSSVWGLRLGIGQWKKQPPPLGPPWGPRRSPTVGSWGSAVSYERGTPVGLRVEGVGSAVGSWALGIAISSGMHSASDLGWEGPFLRLGFKAQRPLYHSTLSSRVIKKKKI